MLALVFFSVSQNTYIGLSSFIHSNDMTGVPKFNKKFSYRRL